MPKLIVLSAHAETVVIERELERAWVEKAARTPDWVEPDPADFELERRFLALPERGGRILRVVCAENDAMIRIVTVFLDRDARRPA